MCAPCFTACISRGIFCNGVIIWPSGFRQNMTADYIFNSRCVQVEDFYPPPPFLSLEGAGLAALGEAGSLLGADLKNHLIAVNFM